MNTQNGEIIFYTSENGNVKINVFFENETIWASQKQIADIFDVSSQNITIHIKNIFESGELSENGTCKKILQVQKEGNREIKREIKIYNLDLILSVGYRVNSYKATQFRIWATSVLKEFIIKGFVMDDERLKNGVNFGKDYFEELLARIREIRASERRFYQKITDIYATSIDYDSRAQISKDFFAEIQNKFLYAVASKTAGEIIFSRVDSQKENMGLTSWKQQKKGEKILKTDVVVGKNYLTEDEISQLNLLVSGYLDFAELQAKKGRLMKMTDWIEKTKNFLKLNDMEILNGKGKISYEQAKQKAIDEFEKFRIIQDKNYTSDFDKFTQNILK